MLVAPSFLSADFLHLDKDVEMMNAHADIFHLDIMDGVFVPNISFGFPVVKAIASAAKRPMDVHLMIKDPAAYVDRFADLGIYMLSFHLEAAREGSAAILDKIHSRGIKAGIAINPDCPVEKVFPLLDKLDFVLVMSVFAGFGGQKFIPETLDRIKTLKAEIDRRGMQVQIEVDGGVSPDNAGDLATAGASILVAGSSVFRSSDPARAIRLIRG